MTTWRYKLAAPFEKSTPHLIGVDFSNEWITIRHGRITIKAGYAWDGCSPSWNIGPLWFGPWDGPLTSSGVPVTFYATLVHDALCQFRPDIKGLSKSATVKLFEDMLVQTKAPKWMIWLYPNAVDIFGPQNWG